MTRAGGGWVPDGRAKAILAGCHASLEALDGLEIDLYLIHAPDPRTPWRTSLRALARLVDEGLVRRVGVSNVNRDQLDEALELAPVSAVQVALSVFDDRALRGGVVERCARARRVGDRARAPRWTARRDAPRSPAGVGGCRRRARGDPGRGGACVAPRPVRRPCSRSRARGARRPRAPQPPPRRWSSTPVSGKRWRARSAASGGRAPQDRVRPATGRSWSSWASPEPGRAASPRTTSRAATCD